MDLSHIVPELRENVLPVESLKFDPQNVRVHDETNMTAVRNSLRRFGMRHAIIVRGEDNIVIAGNARLQAAIDLGWEYVPVTYANDLSDSEATLLAITDNKTSDLGGWNEDLLSSVLKEIEQDDVTLSDMFNLGWSDKELKDLGILELTSPENEEESDDDPVDPPPDPITRPGDIIRLGDHTLRCGDSTEPYDWGVTAQLMVTDPPYGVRYASDDLETMKECNHRTDGKTVQNDDLTDLALQEFLYEVFDSVPLDPGAPWYVFGPSGDQYIYFWTALEASNLNPKHQLVWVKDRMVFGRSDYHYQHESIIYGWKPGAAHFFVDDRTNTTVWEHKKPQRSDEHPTMKPIPLVEKAIFNSSQRGDVVIDPFGGSGTTLLACENLGRVCLTTELDPGYCDVIVDRWEKQTGRKADRP